MSPERYSYFPDRCSISNKVDKNLSIYTDLIVGVDNGKYWFVFIFAYLMYFTCDRKSRNRKSFGIKKAC